MHGAMYGCMWIHRVTLGCVEIYCDIFEFRVTVENRIEKTMENDIGTGIT